MGVKTVKQHKAIENSRGYLVEFPVANFNIQQANILFTYRNNVRGRHYHKITEEYFYVISGMIEVRLLDIRTQERVEFIVTKGDGFHVYPFTYHELHFIEDTTIMSFYSKEFNPADTDIYQL